MCIRDRHKERYLPFMESLADHGYAVVIHDHRGHGKSVRSRHDLGYMYGGGAEALLQDKMCIRDSYCIFSKFFVEALSGGAVKGLSLIHI